MPLSLDQFELLPLPQGMRPNRYFVYRRPR